MSQRLPSLNALRVFLAVAEQQGVSRAAAALHLTHSAVSHQIKLLQDELGVALFARSGRGLVLTPGGTAYAERVARAFAEIDAATRSLRQSAERRPLRISCMPSFAANWLLPRLGEFISAHREIDVEVQSTVRLADVKGGEVDVALRFGLGNYPGLHRERLMRDWHFPVCAPQFAARHGLLPPARRSPANEKKRLADFVSRLDDIPLLRSDNEPWLPWFAAAGVAGREPARGPIFDDASLMLRAAAAGQGICLGRHAITMDEIADGRLIRPFAAAAEAPHAYYFVCRPNELATTPAMLAFHDWLRAQAAATPQPE